MDIDMPTFSHNLTLAGDQLPKAVAAASMALI